MQLKIGSVSLKKSIFNKRNWFMRGLLLIVFIFATSVLQFVNAQRKEFLVGFSQCTTADLWRKTMEKEMEVELAFYPNMQLIKTDAQGNSLKQIDDVKELLLHKIDLLIISPNESEPLTPIVEEVFEKGIPVIVVDRKIESEKFNVFIGADNIEIGRQVGLYAVRKLNGKGRVIEIWGLPGSSPAIERHQGFSEIISEYPEITIKHSINGDWQQEMGYNIMKDLIDKSITGDLLFFHNDFMAMGAYDALEEFNLPKTFTIVSIDGLASENGGIQFIIDEKMDATFLYPTGGYKAIETAWKILNNETIEKVITLNTMLIDESNAIIFKGQMEEMYSMQEKIQKQKDVLGTFQEQARFFRILTLIIGSSFLLVFVLAILLVRAYRYKQNANEELENKNVEINEKNSELETIVNTVQEQKQLIEEYNYELESQNVKLNDSNHELNLKKQQLEEAIGSKNKFFSIIAHDLRSPFGALIGYFNLLLDKNAEFSDDERDKILRNISKSAKRTYALLENLLQWASSQTGGINFSPAKYKINSILCEVQMNANEVAKKKGIKVSIDLSNDFDVEVDKEMIKTVVRNLLSNAIKFTPVNGEISINTKLNKTDFMVSVTDTGVGMSNEDLLTLFNIAETQGKLGTEKEQGSGLGLILCKEFVERHQGKIWAESEIGKGSTFCFSIPLNIG